MGDLKAQGPCRTEKTLICQKRSCFHSVCLQIVVILPSISTSTNTSHKEGRRFVNSASLPFRGVAGNQLMLLMAQCNRRVSKSATKQNLSIYCLLNVSQTKAKHFLGSRLSSFLLVPNIKSVLIEWLWQAEYRGLSPALYTHKGASLTEWVWVEISSSSSLDTLF